MAGKHNTRGEMENGYSVLVGEFKGKRPLGNVGVYEMIILKYILKKRGLMV
jgi:hypothetical protein